MYFMVQELPILSFDIWDMVIGLFGLFWLAIELVLLRRPCNPAG